MQQEIAGRDIDCSVLGKDGEVLAYTIQLMAVLKWNGVAHVDLRQHAATGRVDIIEMNPRLWGSLLGSLHAGVNSRVGWQV